MCLAGSLINAILESEADKTNFPPCVFLHIYSHKNLKLGEKTLEKANYKLGQGANNLNTERSISREILITSP